MATESLADLLEREHRDIDRAVEEYAAGTGSAEALAHAIATLRRHIYLEERFLFPPLRDAGLMAPVFVMLREHGQIWQVLDALDAGLADGADLHDPLRKLAVLEQHHNPKEEQILYPQADRVIGPDEAAGLREFLAAGELPAGWVCERAEMPAP